VRFGFVVVVVVVRSGGANSGLSADGGGRFGFFQLGDVGRKIGDEGSALSLERSEQ